MLIQITIFITSEDFNAVKAALNIYFTHKNNPIKTPSSHPQLPDGNQNFGSFIVFPHAVFLLIVLLPEYCLINS